MKCFLWAAKGIAAAYRRERNLRIHSAAAYFVLWAGVISRISPLEWTAVAICIGAVIAAELFNTALEAACDALTREQSPHIRLAKDAAAGAVLVLAVTSIAVGIAIFVQADNFARGVEAFGSYPLLWAVLAVSLLLFIKIIFFTWRDRHD